jgi:hypothetical protein
MKLTSPFRREMWFINATVLPAFHAFLASQIVVNANDAV